VQIAVRLDEVQKQKAGVLAHAGLSFSGGEN
jgi:hypothetical protein